MEKAPIKEIFIENLERFRKAAGLSQNELARKAGMSPGHLSEVVSGISSIGLEKLNDLAHVLQRMPWELLADGEAARRAAWAGMVWGPGVSDKDVEKHLPLPPAPKREAAPPRKKPPGGGEKAVRPSF